MKQFGAVVFLVLTSGIIFGTISKVVGNDVLKICEVKEAIGEQITPRVLLGTDSYTYDGDRFEYTFSSSQSTVFTLNCWAGFPIRWVFDYDKIQAALFLTGNPSDLLYIRDFRIRNSVLAYMFLKNSELTSKIAYKDSATDYIYKMVHNNINAPSLLYHLQKDGGKVIDISLFQSRSFSDFEDNSTYVYRSVLTLHYQTRITETQIFSCQAVSFPCHRRLVVSKPVNRGRKTNVRWQSDLNIPELEIEKEKEIDSNKTCQAIFYYQKIPEGWRFCCKPTDHTQDFGLAVRYQAMDANTLENVQSKFHRQPEVCAQPLPYDVYCPSRTYVKNSQAFGITCDLQSDTVFPILKAIPAFLETSLYFDWHKIDPEDLIALDNRNPIKAYVNQTVTVICYISVAYFSHGGFIATSDSSQTSLNVYKSNQIDDSTEPYNSSLNAYQIKQSVRISNSTETVYCFAPIWNSTEWTNKSVSVTSLGRVELQIVNASTIEVIKLNVEGKDPTFTLTCVANGFPIPEVKWLFKTKALTESHQVSTAVTMKSTLKFLKVDNSIEGEYRCRALNENGEVEKTFRIQRRVTDGGPNSTLISTMTAAGVFFGLLLTVVFLLWRKNVKQKHKIEYLSAADILGFREGEQYSPNDSFSILKQTYKYNSQYEIDRQRLLINETDVLGSGAFGIVYKGQINMSTARNMQILRIVAIKTVPRVVGILYFKAILSEIKIMASIGPHNNVVQLIGACTRNIAHREVYMAVEFCANGNLKKYLEKKRVDTPIYGPSQSSTHQNCLDREIIPQLNKWSYEIAVGMNFLSSNQVVHGDLAARNILLSGDNVAKIGDFGLARVLVGCSVYVKESTGDVCPLPWKWMPIEALEDMHFSTKTDTWSYGMVLWEIFSLALTPFPGIFSTAQFVADLKMGVRAHQPQYASSAVYDMMKECWKADPADRPTFESLQRTFERDLQLVGTSFLHSEERDSSPLIYTDLS